MFRSFEIQNIMTSKKLIFVLILSLYGVVSSLRSQNELSEAYELSPITITATRTERLEVETSGTINTVSLRQSFIDSLQNAFQDQPLISVPFSFSGTGFAYQRSGAQC